MDHVRLRYGEVDVDAEIEKSNDQVRSNDESDVTAPITNDSGVSDTNNESPTEVAIDDDLNEDSSHISIPVSNENTSNDSGTLLRRSTRIRNPPERYGNAVSND